MLPRHSNEMGMLGARGQKLTALRRPLKVGFLATVVIALGASTASAAVPLGSASPRPWMVQCPGTSLMSRTHMGIMPDMSSGMMIAESMGIVPGMSSGMIRAVSMGTVPGTRTMTGTSTGAGTSMMTGTSTGAGTSMMTGTTADTTAGTTAGTGTVTGTSMMTGTTAGTNMMQ
jgi:hypothetical protein